jgi:hypothetical protein
VGLKKFVGDRNFDATIARAEHQRNRAHRASLFAFAVADAMRRLQKRGLHIHETEHVLLGAGFRAASASDAVIGINKGMKRRRRRNRFLLFRFKLAAMLSFGVKPPPMLPNQNQHRRGKDDQQLRHGDNNSVSSKYKTWL